MESEGWRVGSEGWRVRRGVGGGGCRVKSEGWRVGEGPMLGMPL